MVSSFPKWPVLACSIALTLSGWAVEKNASQLAAEVASPEREVRREATYQLMHRGPAAAPAVAALAKALDDDDKQVWSNALAALAKIGPAAKDAVPALMEKLTMDRGRGGRRFFRDSSQYLYRVAFALGSIGEPALEPLIKSHEGADTDRRRLAAQALSFMGPKAAPAIPALISSFTSDNEELRAALADAFAAIGQPAVEPLRAVLAHEQPVQRENAALALAAIGAPSVPAADALRKMAGADSTPAVRAAALSALHKIGRPSAEIAPLLRDALFHSEEIVRNRAGLIFNARADLRAELAPVLFDALKNKDTAARAARLVGMLGSQGKNAIPALLETARNNPGEPAFADALAQLGEFALPALVAALEKAKPQDVDWIAPALRDLGQPAQIALVNALKNPSAATRAAAVAALGEMGPASEEVEKAAFAAVNDPEPIVVGAALRALVGMRAESGRLAGMLEKAATNPAPPVQQAAVVGLARLGLAKKLDIEALRTLLKSNDNEARRAALEASSDLSQKAAPLLPEIIPLLDVVSLRAPALNTIGKIGPAACESAGDKVFAMAKASDQDSRVSALRCLGQIGKPQAAKFLPLFEEHLNSNDREIRLTAVEAYPRLEADVDKALKKLIPIATDPDSGRSRRMAMQGIRTYGEAAQAAVPALFTMLERPEPDRGEAINTLRAIKPNNVPVLVEALEKASVGAQIAAAYSLSALGERAKAARPALEKLKDSPAPPLKDAVKVALEKIPQ